MSNFRKYRNMYNTLVRASKKLYFTSTLKKHEKDPKKTWETLKDAMNSPKTNTTVECILVNNKLTNNPSEIAEEFNNFFSNIGESISNKINPTILDPTDFIPPNPSPPNFELGPTSPATIFETIKNFTSKSSTDIDGLSTKFLKQIAHVICIPLSHIFNLSLTQGIFPNKFKVSRTVPVFKAGDSEICDNYRPISLLSTLSKILEKHVSIQLTNHLELNNLLYEHQYGFQRGKSTEQNLIHLTNYIYNALNDKKYCLGLFLDLKKAFDVCSHNILLKKLPKYGINDTALKWFESYLKDRQQKVEINGSLSSTKTLNISVIQGSILGPILFLIYINDLYTASKLLKLMFADDTAGLASHNNINDLITFVNTELKKIARWFRANKMAVNVSKTKFIIFHTKGKKIPPNISLTYDDNEPDQNNPELINTIERVHINHPIKQNRAYKLLGVYFDETLSFDYHIQHLISKLNRSLYCINKSKNFLTKPALKSLYFALIHSHLSYCPIITSCATSQNLKKLFTTQKKAIRIITSSNYNAHTDILFKNLKILPLNKLFLNAKLLFMHSVIYDYCPRSFHNIWNTNENRNPDLNHNLRNANQLAIPHPRIDLFKKSALYSLPVLWNDLDELKLQMNKKTFKISLREKMLNEQTDQDDQ
jgi:hypothetical protein